MAHRSGHITSHGHPEVYPPVHHEVTCHSTPKQSEYDLPSGPHNRRKDQRGEGAPSRVAERHQTPCCASGVVIKTPLPGKVSGSKEQSVAIHFGREELVSDEGGNRDQQIPGPTPHTSLPGDGIYEQEQDQRRAEVLGQFTSGDQ